VSPFFLGELVMAKKNKVLNIDAGNSVSETFKNYLGQPCAVLCARFNYRGILVHVGSDHVVLAQARAVESSGVSSGASPSVEDVIGSSVVIMINAIELVYQPNWCFAPLD
jgi:hypothetical protein